MKIICKAECDCFDLLTKKWRKLEADAPMYLFELHYEGNYFVNVYKDEPFWQFDHGHYIIKTKTMYLVIDAREWIKNIEVLADPVNKELVSRWK